MKTYQLVQIASGDVRKSQVHFLSVPVILKRDKSSVKVTNVTGNLAASRNNKSAGKYII